MTLNPIDIATSLLAHVGAVPAYTREFDGYALHAFELPALDVPLFLAEPVAWLDADGAGGADACWIGAEIGTFSCTTELHDVLASSHRSPAELATFPSMIRAGRARLWRREALSADSLSLGGLIDAAKRLTADAAVLNTQWRDELPAYDSAMDDSELTDKGRLDHIERLMRAGGHDHPWPTELWSAQDRGNRLLLRMSHERRWAVGTRGWVAPIETTDPTVIGEFLTLRVPPDCFNGVIDQDKLVVYGAIGSLAFAVEDAYDPKRALLNLLCGAYEPTVLDVLGARISGAEKGAMMFEQAMPQGQFGWLRPFLLVGSTLTGHGEVRVWNSARDAVVVDHEMTKAWQQVLRRPSDLAVIDALIELFVDRFRRLTTPQTDHPHPVPVTKDPEPMTDLDRDISSLAPLPVVESVLRSVVEQRSVLTDRRASYISVRPSPLGAIAAYFHANRITVAVDPDLASGVAAQLPGCVVDRRTPATSYVVIPLASTFVGTNALVDVIAAAVDWRATGPASTLGADRNRAPQQEPDFCPDSIPSSPRPARASATEGLRVQTRDPPVSPMELKARVGAGCSAAARDALT